MSGMLIVYITFLAVGTFFVLWLGYQLFTGLRSRNWPSVVGEIIARETAIEEGEKVSPVSAYVYRYSVRGVNYFNQRVTVSDAFVPREKLVAQILSQYPDGAMVTVYYDRNGPATSLLERGPRTETYVYFGVSLCLLITGLIGVLSKL